MSAFFHGGLKYRLSPGQGVPEALRNLSPEQRLAANRRSQLAKDTGRADANLRKF